MIRKINNTKSSKFSIIYLAPNHNKADSRLFTYRAGPDHTLQLNYIKLIRTQELKKSPHEQALGNSGEEKFPFNRQKPQNRSKTEGGRRSDGAGWVERESVRKRKRGGGWTNSNTTETGRKLMRSTSWTHIWQKEGETVLPLNGIRKFKQQTLDSLDVCKSVFHYD